MGCMDVMNIAGKTLRSCFSVGRQKGCLGTLRYFACPIITTVTFIYVGTRLTPNYKKVGGTFGAVASVSGLTYVWNAEGSDADVVPELDAWVPGSRFIRDNKGRGERIRTEQFDGENPDVLDDVGYLFCAGDGIDELVPRAVAVDAVHLVASTHCGQPCLARLTNVSIRLSEFLKALLALATAIWLEGCALEV